MACTLSNKCAKNLSKRTVLLQLIIKNVVTCFFWNTVYIPSPQGDNATVLEEYALSKCSCLPPTKEEVNAFARFRLSVCLSVSKITQKRVHGFG